MEEHHQLRGDDESHRNNHTQSRCTPRDSALPPLDWHVYFPNVEYDVTSDRRCELASKLIDAFCLATNGAELFDQVIILLCLLIFSSRSETRRKETSISLSVCVCLLARRKRRSRALSFSLILRFLKAETAALSLSLSLCDKLPFCDVDSLYLFSSLSKKTTADESVAREIHRDSVRL